MYKVELKGLTEAREHFKKHLAELRRYSWLADYVGKCYQVIAHNFLDRPPLWYALKNTYVILVGECHEMDEERLNFAEFLHRIWNGENDALLIEHEQILYSGQLTYICPCIATKATCWDISTEEKANATSTRFFDIAFTITQAMLFAQNASDLKNFLSRFSALNSLLMRFSSNRVHTYFLNSLTTFFSSTYEKNQLLLMINTYQVVLRVVHELIRVGNFFQERENQYRDRKFLEAICKQLAAKKRVITISGAMHNHQNSPVVTYLKMYNIPFLSIFGKKVIRKIEEDAMYSPRDCSGLSIIEKRELILNLTTSIFFERKCFYHIHIITDVLQHDLNVLTATYQKQASMSDYINLNTYLHPDLLRESQRNVG